MAMRSIVERLVVAAVVMLPACASNTPSEPPPQTATAAEAPPTDGGLPAVPLQRKGVVVPSDVKLEPAPSAAGPPTAVVPNTTATPTGN
jgi:hypothetical protein